MRGRRIKPKIINVKTIMEAISKIESESRDLIIYIREPDKRPLALYEEESSLMKYYEDLLDRNEVKMKISRIVNTLRIQGFNFVIEEFNDIIGLKKIYVKLYLEDGKLNTSVMVPEITSKNILHKLLIYIEAMLEDLTLSLGLANGTITLMTMNIS